MSDSEKINWTPELLAEVRNEKGVVLGMMSDEARMALFCLLIPITTAKGNSHGQKRYIASCGVGLAQEVNG